MYRMLQPYSTLSKRDPLEQTARSLEVETAIMGKQKSLLELFGRRVFAPI